jgi:Flp pilus assembly protein TadD
MRQIEGYMDRRLIKVVFVAGLMASGALGPAAAQDPAVPSVPMNEMQFVQAAEDAAKNGDIIGAIQLYQSAIIYAPSDPGPYVKLGELLAHNGQPQSAQRYYGLALEVQPAYAPALQGLALLDLASGDRAGAQAQRDVLLQSCGATCPETGQVEKALNGK